MAKKFLSVFLLGLLIFVTVCEKSAPIPVAKATEDGEEDYIKWVDFNVTYEALEDAMNLDIETYQQDLHLPWTESLAYLACRNGGDFSGYKKSQLDSFAEKRTAGSSIEDLTKDFKVYDYYFKAYSAVIGNFLGMREDGTYGLTAYSPVAAGYWYTESDDFGNGRSYGFARKHLGHDMFCSPGTPIMAVEDGTVEALGWNQYGGWRIGIRSGDGQRYYYYAHLRKDSPYAEELKIGSKVNAGQLIGYSGQTGYSIKENVNNIDVPHLHFGMQLIFDESQKECLAEIWIDTYPLIRLLSKNCSDQLSADSSQTASVRTPSFVDSLAAADPAPVKVPILMYHGLTDKQSMINDYYISAADFETDLEYLKSHGYTTVTMTDLINYVYDETGKVTLPQNPVILTFDDGFLNNHTFATPLLKKYGMKAVISVIGSASEEMSQTKYKNEASCAVTWSQLQEMANTGLWEVQNHTYDLHNIKDGRKGAGRKTGESEDSYEKLLKDDLQQLQTQIRETVGVTPNTFTWPFGAYTQESRPLLKEMGFRATLSCASGINEIKKGDTECLYLLKRNIRKPGTDISSCLS